MEKGLINSKNIRTEVFQVPIGSNTSKEIPLGSLTNLRDAKRLLKLEFFHSTQIIKTPEGLDVIDEALLKGSYVVLNDSKSNQLRQIPLTQLTKNVNGTTIEPINIDTIDPTKSYIKVTGDLVPALGKAFVFYATYEKS